MSSVTSKFVPDPFERANLTLSAGITETRSDDDVDTIYERADKALYKAKHSGRNCQFLAD